MSTNVSFRSQQVLEGLRSKDPVCLNSYYSHIHPKAVIIIHRIFPADPSDWLEDCFSTAFLTFLKKIRCPNFQARNIDAYALEIIKRTYFNARKKQKSLAILTDEIPERAHLSPEPSVKNADELFSNLQQKKLLRWYRQLPPRYRRILDLRTQGWDYKEIAEEVNISHTLLRNHFSKLLREARKLA